MSRIFIRDILHFLKTNNFSFNFIGNIDTQIVTFSSLSAVVDNSITWARKIENINLLSIDKFNNVLIVLPKNIESSSINQIIVDDPHLVFFEIIEFFFEEKISHSIHSSSYIKTNNIGNNLNVGAFSFIDENVLIGNNVFISNNVSIQGRVIIGDNTIIEAGVVIGISGFGHSKNNKNIYKRVPHLGGVTIGNDVIIGANSTIARGSLGNTIIGNYVKIDNLCHIAHNVVIKDRSMITACTEISGSTVINEDVWIGPSSTILNGISIGRNSIIGIGTVVSSNVPEGKVVLGYPARIIKDNE